MKTIIDKSNDMNWFLLKILISDIKIANTVSDYDKINNFFMIVSTMTDPDDIFLSLKYITQNVKFDDDKITCPDWNHTCFTPDQLNNLFEKYKNIELFV